jgi:tetratricopeptide (TPR) repeat protein
VEVAHHLRLAAPLIGPAAAIPFLIAAADDALARMAVEQAEEILTDTLTLARGLELAERTTVERQARGRLAVLRVFSGGPAVAEASGLLTPPAPDAELTLDPADPAEWWAAMTVAGALGQYERMVRDAQAALRSELTPAVALMVRMELGLGLFQLGRFRDAATQLRVARALLANGAAAQFVGLSVSADAVLDLQALMAHFRGKEAEADAMLAESTANTERSMTRLVVVTFVKAWLSASRGDASACADHARQCSRMGTELAYPAYVSMGRVLSGWAAAMLGDSSGLEAADDAYAEYVSDGTRLNTTLFSVLRAEAYARHGRVEVARRLVEDARRITAEIGERSLGPRLRALADALAGVESLPPDVQPTEPHRLSSTDY